MIAVHKVFLSYCSAALCFPLLALGLIARLTSEARATPLDSRGIAADFSFIETQAAKTLISLGSPISGYPVSGGNTGTWTTTAPSSGSLRMDKRIFPGRTLVALSGHRVPEMARRSAAMDFPTGLAGFVNQPRGPGRYRLHHQYEFRQWVSVDMRLELQTRNSDCRRVVGIALQSRCRGGSLLDFRSLAVPRDCRQHDDP